MTAVGQVKRAVAAAIEAAGCAAIESYSEEQLKRVCDRGGRRSARRRR